MCGGKSKPQTLPDEKPGQGGILFGFLACILRVLYYLSMSEYCTRINLLTNSGLATKIISACHGSTGLTMTYLRFSYERKTHKFIL